MAGNTHPQVHPRGMGVTMHVEIQARLETRWSDVASFVGLRAVLYDVDPLSEDHLAEEFVAAGGIVRLRFDPRKTHSFDSPSETTPDLRLVVIRSDGRLVFRSRVIDNVRIPVVLEPNTPAVLCELTFVESSLE